MNYVLQWMKENRQPLTVDAYVSLNWGNKTFQELEGEDRAEVDDLLADGALRLEITGTGTIQ
jgi:hypothetical protein